MDILQVSSDGDERIYPSLAFRPGRPVHQPGGASAQLLAICSDQTTTHSEDIQPNEIAGQVTTEPQKIAEVLTEKIETIDQGARATFCTYQSRDTLLTAQTEHGAPKFDLVIVDEAHCTTGLLEEDKPGQFQVIHDRQKIQADKCLYMTATPRIYKESKSKRDFKKAVIALGVSEEDGKQRFNRQNAGGPLRRY